MEVSTYRGSIIFAVIYRHSKTDFKNSQDSLCYILIELKNKKQKYVVSGNIDINFKLASTNFKVINYFNLLNALGSKFLINVPTRFSKSNKHSLLDHFYSNITKKKTPKYLVEPLGPTVGRSIFPLGEMVLSQYEAAFSIPFS